MQADLGEMLTRLRREDLCAPGCEGRCHECPNDLLRKTADALEAERKRAERAEQERDAAIASDNATSDIMGSMNDAAALMAGRFGEVAASLQTAMEMLREAREYVADHATISSRSANFLEQLDAFLNPPQKAEQT